MQHPRGISTELARCAYVASTQAQEIVLGHPQQGSAESLLTTNSGTELRPGYHLSRLLLASMTDAFSPAISAISLHRHRSAFTEQQHVHYRQ